MRDELLRTNVEARNDGKVHLAASARNQALDIMLEATRGQEEWAFTQGVQAYIWGYPLVECWRDRLEKFSQCGEMVNTFRHVRHIASPSEPEFVNSGSDFLYSTAVVDLRDGPVVVTGPEFGGRWYGLQVLDAHMETLCNLGTRTMGGRIVPTVLAPTRSKAVGFGDMDVVYCNCDYLYVVGRIAVTSNEDLKHVHALQDALSLSRVHLDEAKAILPTHRAASANTWVYAPLRSEVDESCPALRFLANLSHVLQRVPLRPDEAMMVGLLSEIGIKPGKPFSERTLSPEILRGLRKALPFAEGILQRKKFAVGTQVNGWTFVRDIGNYHHNYVIRALVARHGIWANVPQESIYLMALTDAGGLALHGGRDYLIRFSANELPAVDAFWSIGYYDATGNMVDGPAKRSISSQDGEICFDSDGSLSVHIGQRARADVPAANWLHAHDGPFTLNLRCYQPRASMLKAAFDLPAVTRVGAR